MTALDEKFKHHVTCNCHPEGDTNACSKVHDNPSNFCTKVVDCPTWRSPELQH